MAKTLNRNLKRQTSDIKLNCLLEITKAINNNFSTSQLLEIFKEVLQTQLNIGKLVLFSNQKGWKCILKYGVTDEYNNVKVERDLLDIKEISTVNLSKNNNNNNNAYEIVIPVFHKSPPRLF